MKENWFNSMFMEGSKISHKRVIAIGLASVLCWGIVYSVVKAVNDTGRYNLLIATGVFVLIMSGVATVAQITSILKGTTPKNDANTEKQEKIQ